MATIFECKQCGTRFSSPEVNADNRNSCPACGAIFSHSSNSTLMILLGVGWMLVGLLGVVPFFLMAFMLSISMAFGGTQYDIVILKMTSSTSMVLLILAGIVTTAGRTWGIYFGLTLCYLILGCEVLILTLEGVVAPPGEEWFTIIKMIGLPLGGMIFAHLVLLIKYRPWSRHKV